MAQLMPLPLTVSCFSRIQIGFTFLVPAHPDSPGQRALKRVCVCTIPSPNVGVGHVFTRILLEFCSCDVNVLTEKKRVQNWSSAQLM